MRDRVLAPAVEVSPHGLVGSGNVVEDDSERRWLNGITFSQRGCYQINGMCYACADVGVVTKSNASDCVAAAKFDPYLLEFAVIWDTPDNFDIKQLMRDELDVGTSTRLENLAWVGCTGNANPKLPGGTSVGSGTPLQAIAKVGAAISTGNGGLKVGGQGTIHVSAYTAALAVDQLYTDAGGDLRTKVGEHLVIAGNYPDNSIAGHLGEVDVYLDTPQLIEAPAEVRRANEALYRVERHALVAWNTCASYVATVS
jgi:hypothetical protein